MAASEEEVERMVAHTAHNQGLGWTLDSGEVHRFLADMCGSCTE
jgi:hypothetical protein